MRAHGDYEKADCKWASRDRSGQTQCERAFCVIYREALKHELEEPKQWEIREINGIMNDSIDGWNAITSTHRFAKYGIQRGWKRVTNDDGMYPVPDGVKIPFDN